MIADMDITSAVSSIPAMLKLMSDLAKLDPKNVAPVLELQGRVTELQVALAEAATSNLALSRKVDELERHLADRRDDSEFRQELHFNGHVYVRGDGAEREYYCPSCLDGQHGLRMRLRAEGRYDAWRCAGAKCNYYYQTDEGRERENDRERSYPRGSDF